MEVGELEWLFSGIGTFLIGLLVGGTGGSAVTWRVMVKKNDESQRQRAGDNSRQIQAGRDIRDIK